LSVIIIITSVINYEGYYITMDFIGKLFCNLVYNTLLMTKK